MANIVRLIASVVLLMFMRVAYAGYAQLSPPAGWSKGTSGSSVYRAAANDAVFKNTVRTTASMSVGGRAVTMPASMRFAANAPRVAAVFGFTPAGIAVIVAAGVGSVLYNYYKSGGFELEDGKWVKKEVHAGTVKQFSFNGESWASSVEEAALQLNGVLIDGLKMKFVSADGTYAKFDLLAPNDDKAGVVYRTAIERVLDIPAEDKRVATQKEFEDSIAALPLPDALPQALPIPLPVEKPILNPSADPEPKPQPLRVPQGEPQPVPNTSPEQYKTPVVDIVPSPTVDDPWRVDLQPKDVIKNDSTPIPEGPPDVSAKPEDKTPGLCDMYPDILACAKLELDTPDSDQVREKEIDITLNPDGGWGGGAGSCPAPRHLKGANVDFDLKGVCDALGMLRPIILAFAWLAAAGILVGASKKE